MKKLKTYRLSQVVEAIELNNALTVKAVRECAEACKLHNDWSAGPLFRLLDKLEGKE